MGPIVDRGNGMRCIATGDDARCLSTDLIEIGRSEGVAILNLGLTLSEAKQLLASVQRAVVSAQADSQGLQRPCGSACSGNVLGQRAIRIYVISIAHTGNDANQGLWTRGLLIRRNIADGDLAYFTTWYPAGTLIETLAASKAIAGRLRTVSRPSRTSSVSTTNETRSWHGWHRHVSLVMLAFAMMAAIQHQANKLAPKNQAGSFNKPLQLVRRSIQEIRRVAHRLAQRRINPAYVIA